MRPTSRSWRRTTTTRRTCGRLSRMSKMSAKTPSQTGSLSLAPASALVVAEPARCSTQHAAKRNASGESSPSHIHQPLCQHICFIDDTTSTDDFAPRPKHALEAARARRLTTDLCPKRGAVRAPCQPRGARARRPCPWSRQRRKRRVQRPPRRKLASALASAPRASAARRAAARLHARGSRCCTHAGSSDRVASAASLHVPLL